MASERGFVSWMLQSSVPSLRYLTLRRLLGRGEADAEVVAARRAMAEGGPIAEILAAQGPDGSWAPEQSFYTPKYVSSHWSLMLLVELAAEPAHPGMQRGARFMLEDTANRLGGTHQESYGWECLWGNILRYVCYAGQADDPRVTPMVGYLADAAVRRSWRCQHNYELPCAWGAARALWGLVALPAAQRTPDVSAAVEQALVFLLDDFSLVLADYPTDQVSRFWHRLNFPLFYQADILFVLRLLAELEALDRPGAQPALDWLASRRRADGRWTGASPFRRRTWSSAVPDRAEADRWVSLHAATVLQQAGRWVAPAAPL